MDVLEQSSAAISSLINETRKLQYGEAPNPFKIAGIQSELVDLIWQVGNAQSEAFRAKEIAGLKKKMVQASAYASCREEKISVEDAKHRVVIASQEEVEAEIEAEKKWEQHRLMLDSLKKAFDHSRSIVSLLKTSESYQ